jgi:hypothetical protein
MGVPIRKPTAIAQPVLQMDRCAPRQDGKGIASSGFSQGNANTCQITLVVKVVDRFTGRLGTLAPVSDCLSCQGLCGRMLGLATYTEADRRDRIKLSSLHRSGNISYYKSGL